MAAKGSRPFTAATQDGRALFIKVLGSDQRDADLLYRAWRFIRLRDVGDTRPAASLIQAAEHQALVAVMAQRAGVAVPAVRQVIKAADGSAVLAMDRVDGRSLDLIPARRVDDAMLRQVWEQVDALHRARIAHRSLRAANVVVDGSARPWIVDFSFAELGATPRQIALDVAELLASLAVIAGADRAVAAAAAVIGPDEVAAAVPLLQPLALSAGTRRAIARQDGLLTQTRQAAAAASGRTDTDPARLQRVRPRTLFAVAAAAGAYYYLLPELAKVPSSWRAVQSPNWAWVPLVIALSAVTYLASAIGLMGAISQRIRLWPTVLAQGASSFINRVSPANVGGMALNARYLQKSGVEPTAGVAAVGVNSLAGVIVHLILTVIFFAWSSRRLGRRRPHPRWHRRLRGGRGRRPDRCRHGSRSRGFCGAAAPAGHLLAPGGTGLAGLARPATAGVRVKPDPKLRAACIWLVIALAACAFPRRQRLVRRRRAGLASRADHPFSAAPTVLGRHANHAPAATCPAVGYGLPSPS